MLAYFVMSLQLQLKARTGTIWPLLPFLPSPKCPYLEKASKDVPTLDWFGIFHFGLPSRHLGRVMIELHCPVKTNWDKVSQYEPEAIIMYFGALASLFTFPVSVFAD
jgi:hypothetical protein